MKIIFPYEDNVSYVIFQESYRLINSFTVLSRGLLELIISITKFEKKSACWYKFFVVSGNIKAQNG